MFRELLVSNLCRHEECTYTLLITAPFHLTYYGILPDLKYHKYTGKLKKKVEAVGF